MTDTAEQSEAEFLANYDPTRFAPTAVTVDLALMTVRDGQLAVLLVKRGGHPYKGAWALPGGFVEPDEDLDDAARRELAEETGLDVDPWHVEQLRTYGDPYRDPRMRIVSVSYLAFLPTGTEPAAGSDAEDARWWTVDDLWDDDSGPHLAFDHDRIISDAVERCRAKLEYTTLAAAFLEEPFTLGDLRRVYEAVWGVKLHGSNFARKLTTADGYLEEASRREQGKSTLYRRGPATMMMPPLIRPEDSEGSRS